MAGTLTLESLITYADEESRNFQEFFRTHPQAIELKTDIAHGSSVRDLLVHIFAVEYLYTKRIAGEPDTAMDQIAARAAADPFALGEQARRWYRDYLASADDAKLDTRMTFSTLSAGQQSATRRKMFAHALLHGIRHWAQLATLLRTNGYSTGRHDFLYSGGMK